MREPRLEPLLIVREDPAGYDEDARRLAEALLRRFALVAGGRRHRIVELELYYWGGGVRDPHAHRDPVQLDPNRWYFHRRGGSYRGGTFKGLDLTFGRPGSYGGVLLRSLRDDAGALVSGPSLLVDRLLSLTGAASIAELDARIAGREATDPASPLHLSPAEPLPALPLRTARVGLTLEPKSGASREELAAHLFRPDRYLTAPREVKKGRVHTVLALLQSGASPEEVRAETGSPLPSVERIRGAYLRGLREGRLELAGRPTSTTEIARRHGAWAARYGADPDRRGG